MFMFDIDRWVEIWVTITRNKTRSLLTGFGVFWGILMLVILLGSGNGFKNGVLKNVDGFSTNSAFFFSERTGEPYKGYKKGRYWQMRNRDLETIRQRVKGVRYLSPMIMQWGGQNNVVRGQKAGTYNVRGVYSEYFNIETQHILAGRLLNEIDMIEKRKVCLIGNIVREVLFAPDEDPIGQYIRVNGIYYQVVGVIKPKPRAQIGGRTEESVMIPFKTLQQASNQGDKFWFLCATADDGTTIATVADMSNMIFRGKVDETEVGRIHEGMPIKLTVGAMESRTFDAELEYVAPKGVEENGAVLFEVKAAVHMPGDAFIRAGYSANAEIVLKRAENVLSVPESCVEFSGDSTFVQVVKAEKPEQKFEKRAVKVGLSDGIKIEIKEGLAENEKVRGAIVDPNKK